MHPLASSLPAGASIAVLGCAFAAYVGWDELARAPLRRAAVVTALAGAVFAALLLAGAAPLAAGLAAAVAANCAVIAEIDARLQIIPDPTVVALGVLAVIAAAPDEFLSLFVGATIAGGVFVAARQGYFLWRKREGLGLGDVKFALAMGALIGAQAALLATAAAAAITIVWLLAQARATPAEGVAVADFSLREAPFGVGLAAVTAIVFVLQTASWP